MIPIYIFNIKYYISILYLNIIPINNIIQNLISKLSTGIKYIVILSKLISKLS